MAGFHQRLHSCSITTRLRSKDAVTGLGFGVFHRKFLPVGQISQVVFTGEIQFQRLIGVDDQADLGGCDHDGP